MTNTGPAGADVAQVFRGARGHAIAALVRTLGDLDAAEEAVQDAFVAALSRWPSEGTPRRPVAWIIRVAFHRAVDRKRRDARGEALGAEPVDDAGAMQTLEPLDDDPLRLIFMCCHPALAMEARVALTLRTLCGLTTEDVAHAFLIPEPTVAQRIVRAKRKIRDAAIPFAVPTASDLAERLDGVLAVLYLTYNTGVGADAGATDLRGEAIRLGRLVHALLPGAPEAAGLLGLLLLNESRRAAARTPDGELILLRDQDRAAWDVSLIEEGHALLRTCLELNRPGPYQIQGAIQAVHADAKSVDETDWHQIVALYDLMVEVAETPVVHLNRAIAIGELEGPEAALALIEPLPLGEYYLYHSALGYLYQGLGQGDVARRAYRTALELAPTVTERTFLKGRLRALPGTPGENAEDAGE